MTDLQVDGENGWTRFWNHGRLWKAALAVVVYLALYQLLGYAAIPLIRPFIDTENFFATPASVFFGLGAPVAIGAIILIVFVLSLGWFKPLFAPQPVKGRWWMWFFVVLVVVPIVLRFAGIDYAGYGIDVVITALFVGLFIGFVEEILYRGIVVKILRSAGHREWTVAVVSSLIFALSHSINLISGMPVLTVALTVLFTFGFGMMMYLVMRVTGNIIWAMLIHAMTDPTTFLGSGGIDASSGAAHSPLIDIAGPFSLIFVGAALIAMIFIRGKAAYTSTIR